MFPAIHLGSFTIGTYMICALLGLFVSGITIYKLGKKYGFDISDLALTMVCLLLGLVFGGRLLFSLTNYELLIDLFKHINRIFTAQFWKNTLIVCGGNVFYGGFLGGLLGLLVLTHFYKYISRKLALDLYGIATPLFHFFGRIGCFFAGCCYGKECKIGFVAHNNPYVPELNGVCRFPVQLLESLCNLFIFLILYKMYKSEKYVGKILYRYLLIYPPVRFCLEFLRGDAIRGLFFGLSTSQWISLVLFTFAVLKVIKERWVKPLDEKSL